jgi:spore coat protein A
VAITRRNLVLGGSGVVLTGLAIGPAIRSRHAPRVGAVARPSAAPNGSLCVSPTAPTSRPTATRPVRSPLHIEKLERFVDRLPVPPTLQAEGVRPDPLERDRAIRFYRVAMRETDVLVHRDMPPTRMWGYAGSVPGPTLDTRSAEPFLVEWVNELPTEHLLPIDHTLHGAGHDRPDVRAVVHVHGARVPPEADGHPESWHLPGTSAVYRYPSRQEAATLWYHDHAMGIERLNQYSGLFGVCIVRDAVEDHLDLPRGDMELPIVLCDRFFETDGRLRYPTSGDPESPWVAEVYGDAHLVNGKLFPYADVAPRRYRLRVVNASNARVYSLSFSNGMSFHQIGSDQGFLAEPLALTSVALAPAERADLVVDFGDVADKTVVLESQSLELLQFRVGHGPREHARALPSKLRPLPRTPPSAAIRTRTLTLNEYSDPRTQRMLMLLNGAYWHEPVTEKPRLGTTEIWELVNLTQDMHPIHLHLVRFQVLDRQPFDADEFLTSGSMRRIGRPVPPSAGEMGWKDTVRAEPGTITRIIVQFEGFAGSYVWHCHVLEHAANEMMRPFEVVA